MEEPTPRQLKGFNAGYELAKHEPELLAQLEKSLNGDSEYIQGLQFGKKQYDREMLLDQLKQSQKINKERKRGPEL